MLWLVLFPEKKKKQFLNSHPGWIVGSSGGGAYNCKFAFAMKNSLQTMPCLLKSITFCAQRTAMFFIMQEYLQTKSWNHVRTIFGHEDPDKVCIFHSVLSASICTTMSANYSAPVPWMSGFIYHQGIPSLLLTIKTLSAYHAKLSW